MKEEKEGFKDHLIKEKLITALIETFKYDPEAKGQFDRFAGMINRKLEMVYPDEKVKPAISESTLRRIWKKHVPKFNPDEQDVSISSYSDLARSLGYLGWRDYVVKNGQSEDIVHDIRHIGNIIHPDDFDNKDVQKGDILFVGTHEMYAKLECVADYFEYKVLERFNTKKAINEHFYTLGFEIAKDNYGGKYIKLTDFGEGYFKMIEGKEEEDQIPVEYYYL